MRILLVAGSRQPWRNFSMAVESWMLPTLLSHCYSSLPRKEQSSSMLCGSLDRRGVRGRIAICICMAESLHRSPETITTLLIGYTPIPNKKFKKQNKTEVLLKKSQERILIGLTVATCLALVTTTVVKERRQCENI